jgi:hypothetical protein
MKNRARRQSQMKFYKVMAIPILLYGSETWTIKIRDINRIQATEMRHLISIKVRTRADHIRHEDIRRELHIHSVQQDRNE